MTEEDLDEVTAHILQYLGKDQIATGSENLIVDIKKKIIENLKRKATNRYFDDGGNPEHSWISLFDAIDVVTEVE